MPRPRVRRVQELDVNKIDFSEASENNYGGKVVYLKYVNEDGEKENIYLQTPKMYNSWGMHISQAKDTNGKPMSDPRYYLQLSFGAADKMRGSVKKFHEFINSLDEKVKEMARENCVSWLKIKKTPKSGNLIDEKYRHTIAYSVDATSLERDGKYPDSIRFKIPYDSEGKVFYNTVEVYDENGDYQSTKDVADMQKWLTKGSNDIAIVQLQSVYFAGGNFGLSWKVVQIQAFPRTDALNGFAIQTNDDEDDNHYEPAADQDLPDEEEV